MPPPRHPSKRELEQRLDALSAKLAALESEASPHAAVPFAMARIVPSSRTIRCNAAAARLAGLGESSASLDDAFPDQRDRARVERACERLRAGEAEVLALAGLSMAGRVVDAEARAAGDGAAWLSLRQPAAADPVARIESLHTLLGKLLEGEPLADFLARLARCAEAHSPGARCAVMLLDDEGEWLSTAAAPNFEPAREPHVRKVAPQAGLFAPARAIALRQRVWSDAIADDPDWIDELKEWAARHGLRSAFALPFYGSTGSPLGVLALYGREPATRDEDDLQFLEALAFAAALAAEQRRHRAVEDRLSILVEQSPDPILVTSTAGRILYVNQAFTRVLGYPRAEAIGSQASILKSGRHDNGFYRDMWGKLNRGQAWTGRFINKRRDGTLVTQDAAISPIRSDDGQVTSYASTLRTVGRENTLEDQLRQAQKMEAVGRLAGGVAHDFNNILQALTVGLSFADSLMEPDHPARPDVEAARASADRAVVLTSQLLSFSRRQIMNAGPLDLNACVRAHAERLRAGLPPGIRFELRLGKSVGRVRADDGALGQILEQLCANAAEAMPEGGDLRISTTKAHIDDEFRSRHPWAVEGSYARLRITDSGCGMDAETLSHIYEPFFTTKRSPDRKRSGLGLSVVYGLVKQLEGVVLCSSSPGQGSQFDIHLPLAARGQQALAPSDGPAGRDNGAPGGTETILLAEDEEAVREVAVRLLERAGYRVVSARDGDMALRLFEMMEADVDLALLDVVMPKMNGSDLCIRLRESNPRLPILLVSGYAHEALAVRVDSEDLTDLLPKPYTRDALLQRVRSLLDRAAAAD